MATKSRENLDTVSNVFEQQRDQWISSKGVQDLLPQLQRQDVYASVSELSRSGILEKRKITNGAGFEYKFNPEENRISRHTEVRREQRDKILNPQNHSENSESSMNMSEPNLGAEDSSNQQGSSDLASQPHNKEPQSDAASGNAGTAADPVKSEAEQMSLLDEPDSSVEVKVIPEGVRGRSPRVVWTSDEKLAIAKEVVRLQKLQPHLTVMNAVRLAQEILPEKRRRLVQIQNRHHIPWIDEMLEVARADDSSTSSVIVDSPRNEANVTGQSSAFSQDAMERTATSSSPESVHPLESATTTQLVDILLQRFGQTFKTMFLEVLKSDEAKEILLGVRSPTAAEQSAAAVLTPARPEASAHSQSFSTGGPVPLSSLQSSEANVLPAVTRQRMPDIGKESGKQAVPRLKRVLVMGLIPSQIQEVANEFKGALDMRFWRTDQSPNLLKSLSKQVDQTVIMTDFIAHSHEGMIKNSGVPYVRQPGGISRLKDTLTHIYANDEP